MSNIYLSDKRFSSDELQHPLFANHMHPALKLAHAWLTGSETFDFHTSGSTGTPKEITCSRNQVSASINRTLKYFGLNQTDHFYCGLSTETIAGGMMVLRALVANADLTLDVPGSKNLENLPANHPYTFGSFVPMQLYGMENNKRMQENLHRFSILLVGGAAIRHEMEKYFSPIDHPTVFQTYGMTETLSHIAVRRLGKDPYYSLLPGIEIKQDSRNCLSIKADVTNEEWIQTNDLVSLIDSNTFNLLGRLDEVINSGGFKVHPEKVEKVLSVWLKEFQFFVCGIPDEKLGETVTLVIEGNEILDLEILRKQCGSELHPFEFPKKCIAIPSFIKTTSGKTDRLKTIQGI